MTRAIPVDPNFDPVPSLTSVPAIIVSVAAAEPDDVGLSAVLVDAASRASDVDQGALRATGFEARPGQVHVIAGLPPKVLAGTGDGLDLASARDVGAAIALSIPSASALSIHVGEASAEVAQGLVEGVILARYSWNPLRAEAASTPVQAITLVSQSPAVERGANRGHLKAFATAVARDLSNAPPAHLTAVRWAALAERWAPAIGLGVRSVACGFVALVRTTRWWAPGTRQRRGR